MGNWKKDLYPERDEKKIAVGLTWSMLGSPDARKRWRAAHTVRCFARFERSGYYWFFKFKDEDRFAHPFQAPGFNFITCMPVFGFL